jgi:hypothetical protein
MEGVAIGHIFERDPHRDHYCQVWFNLVQRFQRRRFKCDLLSISASTKMAAKQKIEKKGGDILIVHCSFSIIQNELIF